MGKDKRQQQEESDEENENDYLEEENVEEIDSVDVSEEEETSEDEMKQENEPSHREDVVDDLFYDPYNLTVCSFHPLKLQSNNGNSEDLENIIVQQATRAAQLLYKR
jgi:regulator of replication initiation timing